MDSSNIDFILPRIIKVCNVLNRHWKIRAIPGVEITHAPIQEIKSLVRFAKKRGAKIIIVHGETVSEPVIPGTNRAAIEAGCDILAHPGLITRKDMELAKLKGVCLELTTRKNHSSTNKRLFKMARSVGAKLVLDNDTHDSDDLVTLDQAKRVLKRIGANDTEIRSILRNSIELGKK